MKAWAEKRLRELETAAEEELAEVFRLVIKILELEDELNSEADL